MSQKNKKLEQELKKRYKALKDEQEKVDILKKSLHIIKQPQKIKYDGLKIE